VWFPKLLAVPSEVGRTVAKQMMTPWQLFLYLTEYIADKGQDVTDYLLPVMCWAAYSAMAGTRVSRFAFTFNPVVRQSARVTAAMQNQLNVTIEMRRETMPTLPPPAAAGYYAVPHGQVAAQQALLSMAAHQQQQPAPSTDQLSKAFTKGVEQAFRIHHEQQSDSAYKRFLDV